VSINKLWVEKYRPTTLEGYVFRDKKQKHQVQEWIDSKSIPHIIMHGPAGTGKTTLSKVLLNEIDTDWGDVLFINASVTNGVDDIRNNITNFCTTMPFGEFKYVILDEADYLSKNAQAALRGVMEKYSNTARFILTCNYPHKIIPAVHSRSQSLAFEKLDMTEFTARVAEILIAENVTFDIESLDTFVRASYPDMRKAIGSVQQCSQSGTLLVPTVDDAISTTDYKTVMVEMFRNGKTREARELIIKQISPEEYDDMYRFMYQNLDLWGDDYDTQSKALMYIRNAVVNDTVTIHRDINLAACLVELEYLID
jgi:replication factor C small subunit